MTSFACPEEQASPPTTHDNQRAVTESQRTAKHRQMVWQCSHGLGPLAGQRSSSAWEGWCAEHHLALPQSPACCAEPRATQQIVIKAGLSRCCFRVPIISQLKHSFSIQPQTQIARKLAWLDVLKFYFISGGVRGKKKKKTIFNLATGITNTWEWELTALICGYFSTASSQ